MLVIGSSALAAAGITLGRKISDLDIICSQADYEKLLVHYQDKLVLAQKTSDKSFALHVSGMTPIDVEIAQPGSAAEDLLVMAASGRYVIENADLTNPAYQFASPDLVYTLKMSHRYLKNNPHFRKTMSDIKFLREYGCQLPEELSDWYKKRMKETYNYSHPKLNQDSKSFFSDDAVNYIYDHDSIHEAVKLFGRPAFEQIKDDAAEVFCSKEKFLEAPLAVKWATVLEESYVLALERHQIPNKFEPDPQRSFLIALEKVCTSIASGWWRQFAWENYDEVRNLYEADYVDRFKAALAAGKIRPYIENSSQNGLDA